MNKIRVFHALIECWESYETLCDEHNEYGTDVVELTKRMIAAAEKVAPEECWTHEEKSPDAAPAMNYYHKGTGVTYHMSVVEVKLVC